MLPFTAISIPIYVIFVCALIKYRKSELSGAFYTLHISIAVADLLSLIFCKLFYKFPVFCGIFPLGYDVAMRYSYFFGKLIMFMFWYSMHVQICGVVVVTINRFTALVFPLKHNKIWSKRFLGLMIIGMWLLPLAFSVLVLTTKMELKASLNSDGELRWYSFDYEDERVETIIFGVSGIWIGIVLNVTLFVMYLIQFIKFAQNRAALRKSNVAAKTKAYTELKLALCGFVVFLVLSVLGLIFLRMIAENLFNDYCRVCIPLYSVFGDINAWITPYVLLVISSQTRHCFLNTIGLGRFIKKTEVVPLTSSVGGTLELRKNSQHSGRS
uniref:G-protein coupled receptors family 1 profile domain-containing protein n=1 Tax=Plectus sambesii TaxID=2011161 RepID=A0A914XJN1_9BILA